MTEWSGIQVRENSRIFALYPDIFWQRVVLICPPLHDKYPIIHLFWLSDNGTLDHGADRISVHRNIRESVRDDDVRRYGKNILHRLADDICNIFPDLAPSFFIMRLVEFELVEALAKLRGFMGYVLLLETCEGKQMQYIVWASGRLTPLETVMDPKFTMDMSL